MKLLFCSDCGDIFNLKQHMKSCGCGYTKGRYINETEAVVNGNGHSIAIGNGSLWQALAAVKPNQKDFIDTYDAWARHPTTIICWARPHSGEANPHTTVDPMVDMMV